MISNRTFTALIFCLFAGIAAAATPGAKSTTLSAAEIVSRNVAARGGLQAWREVQSISMKGKLGVGGNQRALLPAPLPGKKEAVLPTDAKPNEEILLPFVMDMQRSHKMRFELQFKGQAAVQVFDGTNGWKLRPYLNRIEVEPYSPVELKKASMQAELDGPLIDYLAKGTTVELDGTEAFEDRQVYRLKLSLKDGNKLHVWIDGKTFLETKIEGQPRRLDGVEHPVEIYFKDYRSVGGLQMPFLLQTKVLPSNDPPGKVKPQSIPIEEIRIEKISVNPKLDAALFVKPHLETASLSVK